MCEKKAEGTREQLALGLPSISLPPWNANQVMDHIWVGSQEAANNAEECKSHGITHIISIRSCHTEWGDTLSIVRRFITRHHPILTFIGQYADWSTHPDLKLVSHPKIHYLRLWYDDDPNMPIRKSFQKACYFIDRAISAPTTNRILIHCYKGISRSATIAIAYELWKCAKKCPRSGGVLEPRFICRELQRYRPCIEPNDGFLAQLTEWRREVMKRFQ